MVTQLQFVAIAAFLIWCLVSSLCGLHGPDTAPARLAWREHGPAGWSKWRGVHFGLTVAARRVLTDPEPVVDATVCATLLDVVRRQARHPESDAIQFAIVRVTPEPGQPTVVFASDVLSVLSRTRG